MSDNPFAKMIKSRKDIIMVVAVVATVVLIGIDKLSLEGAGGFMATIASAWMLARGYEDGKAREADRRITAKVDRR